MKKERKEIAYFQTVHAKAKSMTCRLWAPPVRNFCVSLRMYGRGPMKCKSVGSPKVMAHQIFFAQPIKYTLEALEK